MLILFASCTSWVLRLGFSEALALGTLSSYGLPAEVYEVCSVIFFTWDLFILVVVVVVAAAIYLILK